MEQGLHRCRLNDFHFQVCRAEEKYLLVEIDDTQEIDNGIERGYAPKREPTPVPPMTKPPSWKPNWQANWKAPPPSWKHREDKPILPTWKPNWKPSMKPTWKPAVKPSWKPNIQAPKYYQPYESRPYEKVR